MNHSSHLELDGTSEADDENFRVEFSNLKMIERIGSGAFGKIYKCRWRGILVAAKCIKASKIQREWLLKNRSGARAEDRIKNRMDAIQQTCITDEEKRLALEDFCRETIIGLSVGDSTKIGTDKLAKKHLLIKLLNSDDGGLSMPSYLMDDAFSGMNIM